jgi:tetratricopeptide (TPR) repeat protein
MIGRNLWNTGYYRDGLEYFKNSIDTATNHTLANQARFFIGKMHEEKKRYPKATKYYTELISKSSDEYAERAAWQLGWMNYTIGNFKKAYDYFDNSVRKYPSGLFIESSMFWSAKSAKQLKRMGLAQQIFANVNMRFPYTYYGIRAGEMKSDKKLFKDIKTSKFAGKITPEVSGQIFLPRETTPIKDKTKHFILVATRSNSLNVRKNPSSSSPVVARLLKGSKVPHIKNNTPENRDGSWFYIEYSKGKFGWVSSSYTKEITDSGSRITQQPNLKTLKPKKVHTSETPRTSELRELKSPEIPREQEPPFATPILSTDAHFHHSRGVELSAIGFYEDARLEIKKLESTIRKNLSGVLWLTKLYNDAHAYSDTMRVMQLYKDFKTKLLEKDLTKNFWENFYPLAYAKAIRDNAKIFNIDPYFVKGLIRQESLFNSQVQSRAGAIGLMQIMPETGRVLYANSTKSEPFNTTILFNPETNIQLGIQYIGQLNKRFKKNKTHILISYNAGPHNLKKWLKRFSHLQDPDVFIESIPYPETRKYVKKVLRNYGIYQSLYSKKNL